METGEWRGLTVSVEDCHSKGRRFEPPSIFFFFFGLQLTPTYIKWKEPLVYVKIRRHARKRKKNWQVFKSGVDVQEEQAQLEGHLH